MGRLWLFADSCLGTEQLRVRLGPIVGDIVELMDFGVGQGRRTEPVYFQALLRPLRDCCSSAAVGVGLDPPCLTQAGMEGDAIREDNNYVIDWALVNAF